jgi:hypothetical protein
MAENREQRLRSVDPEKASDINPYCIATGNNDGSIRFGDLGMDGAKAGVMLRNGMPFAESTHYTRMLSTGKFAGGTTNRCPGVYQIKCGNAPVDDTSFILHAVDGDIVIGAPSGRIRIFAESIDLIAEGGGQKGNINIIATNTVNTDAKQIKSKASASFNIATAGIGEITCSNILYLDAAFIKEGSSAAVSLPPTLGNVGPTELIKTLKKILTTFL